jgi:RNA polymerase sigma-70 factor (ECF subfamily)
MAGSADAQLVARCRTGDDDAWRELVDRFSRYVNAIVTQVYGLRGHDAEDAFQDVFARAWERLHTLRTDDAVRPWIAQLTRRICIDRLRGSGREVVVEEPPEEAVEAKLAELDEAMDVHAALARLQPECREIIDRFFLRDESYRTIADSLDLPPGTVASRISRCLGKLREELEGRNPDRTASGEKVTR